MSDILLTNHDAARILGGHPMTCSDVDGVSHVIRLATAEEFIVMNRSAIAKLFPNGGGPAPVSMTQAINLTKPVEALR